MGWTMYVVNISGDSTFMSNSEVVASQSPSPVTSGGPTPAPTVPEFTELVILPLFVSALFVAVIFRNRKQLKQG